MTKRFHRHKLLLDENFPVRSYFSNLNRRHDVKHLSKDLSLAGLPDDKVYKFAQKQERIIVTYNIKDFIPLVENDTKSTKKSLLGKLTTISGKALDKHF